MRIEAVQAGNKRVLGIPAVAAKFGKAQTTFTNWHTWGTRLLHLCCAGKYFDSVLNLLFESDPLLGTMYILPIIACLRLRTSFTTGYESTTKNINSLADAFREVKGEFPFLLHCRSPFPDSFGSEGKWRPLVKRLIVAIQYLREQNIPILDNYKFVRGEDTFQFSDVEQGDRVLGTVQTK